MTAPTPQPDAERVEGEPTTAVLAAAEALRVASGVTLPWAMSVTPEMLRAALDVPQMASVIVDHLNTDTLPGDSETLVCAGCGHVLVTGDPDDDRDPQAEHATHHAALIRAAILGSDQ